MNPSPQSKTESRSFDSITAFYPFYLSEHRSRANRRVHFAGTSLVLLLLAAAIITRNFWLLLALPLAGYGFAWFGHFFIEHNKPATFQHPWYSLACDFVMYKDMLIGRIKF